MKKQLRILLAGAMVVVPLAFTIGVIAWIGAKLDGLVEPVLGPKLMFTGVGAVVVVVVMYVAGLATHFWVFRGFFGLVERLVVRVPGVKTIYEAVRDLMKLFGSEARRMGRVVEYRPPGANMTLMGILTNEQPVGIDAVDGQQKVAVYLPFSYMFGGLTVYANPDELREVNIPVEQALKVCTTAQVSSLGEPETPPSDQAASE